jgi:hypothetical protein
MTARTGKVEQDKVEQNMQAERDRTGVPKQDSQERLAETGHSD